MHEKCIEFVVEYCRQSCPTWANCIKTARGYDEGTLNDLKGLLFCLKCVEAEKLGLEVDEEAIDKEIDALEAI